MAALTNTQISVTYVGLLKTSANTVLSSTGQQITDGEGNNSILFLSTAGVGIGGAASSGKELDVTGNVLVTGDLQVDNIKIDGNTISAESGVVTLSNGAIATTQSQNDNSTKIATTAYVDAAIDGIDTLAEILAIGNTTGGTDIAVSANDDITFTSSSKAIFGPSTDLQIYSDASNNYIDSTSNELRIRSNDLRLLNYGSAKYITADSGADVSLYHNDSKKFETTSTGAKVTGSNLNVFASSGATKLEFGQTNGNWKIEAGNSGNNTLIIGSVSNATNNITLDTTNGGSATFSGNITFGDSHFIGDDGSDNLLIQSSAGENIIIDSADDIILDADGGDIKFQDNGSGFMQFTNSSGNAIITTNSDDKDLIFKGYDGGSLITALTLDMSEGGNATFAGHITLNGDGKAYKLNPTSYDDWQISVDSNGFIIYNETDSRYDLKIAGDGNATFAGNVDIIKTTSDVAGELRIGGILASDNLPFGKINFANTAAANSQTNDVLAYIAGEKVGSSNRGELTFATSDNSAPVERLRIDSSGNVGIGTSSPVVKLAVKSSQEQLTLSEGDARGATFDYRSSTGNLNIATNGINARTNPQFTLDLNGNVGIKNTVASTIDGASALGTLVVGDGSSVEGITIYTGTSNYGGLNFADATSGGGAYAGYIKFDHSNNSFGHYIGNTERLRITSGGNVGIGTTSPECKLQVVSTTTGNTKTVLIQNSSTGDASMQFNVSGQSYIMGIDYDDSKKFKIASSGALGTTDRITLLSDGKVGIGTITPGAKLHVDNSAADAIIRLSKGSSTIGNIDFVNEGNRFSIQDDGTRRLVIDTSGNVGIGTTSPTAKLDVSGMGTGGVGVRIKDAQNVAGNYYYGFMFDGTDVRGTTQSNIFYAGGSVNANTTITDWASVRIDTPSVAATGAVVTNNYGIYQSSNLQKNYFAGNVGIGTTSPNGKLHIKDGLTCSIDIENTSNTGTGEITFNDPDADDRGVISYSHNLDAMIFKTDATEQVRILPTGSFCIGGTAIQAVGAVTFDTGTNGFTITNNTTSGAGNGHEFQTFRRNSTQIGSIVMNGTTGITYGTSSDYRLKEDFQDFAGLDMISKIPVYDFKWKADGNRGYGVMAHELQEVLPQAVTNEKDSEKMQEVDYSKIVPLLVKSIQELKKEIETLKSK